MAFVKRWLPAVIWAGFIFFLSSRQFGGLSLFPGADKIIHICIYMVLGYFTAKALIKGHKLERYQVIIIATLVAGVYGLSDEFHQSFVPGRTMEMLDLLSDFLGGFLGSLINVVAPRHTAGGQAFMGRNIIQKEKGKREK